MTVIIRFVSIGCLTASIRPKRSTAVFQDSCELVDQTNALQTDLRPSPFRIRGRRCPTRVDWDPKSDACGSRVRAPHGMLAGWGCDEGRLGRCRRVDRAWHALARIRRTSAA